MTTRRFYTLDAVRGLAALVVVFYHSDLLHGRPCLRTDPCDVRFGYLAVDLFFMLSGFVIAHAYDDRLRAGLTTRAFMRVRAIRLLPIYWLGSLAGIALPLVDCLKGKLAVVRLLAPILPGVAMLPSPVYFQEPSPFPFDSPAWSLFFEFWIANLAFVLGFRILTGARLLMLVVVALLTLVWLQQGAGTINLGWGWGNLLGGVPRTLFWFFVGVALNRLRPRLPCFSPPSWVVLLLVGLSFFPPLGGTAALVYEVAAIALVYPLLIHAGAGALERRPQLGALFGDLSYALYLVHFPILMCFARALYVLRLTPSPLLEGAYVLACLASAWFVNACYDLPVRRWLAGRLPATERRRS